MANIGNLIANKNTTNAEWRKQRQAERENFLGMQDAAITEITSNPEMYAQYLELQASNPQYSVGNNALALCQFSKVSVFGTVNRWKTLSRSVKDAELANGAKVFSRAANGKGYDLVNAYDVSQTQGRPLNEVQLQNDTKEMETAINTLLNYANVPLATEKMDIPAMYDESKMELVVNPDVPDDVIFAAIATEIAHARMHAKGSNTFYDRSECELDAQSVSYLLCCRFGVKCEFPDASRVAELYSGWDALRRRKALDSNQDMSKTIGNAIESKISPQLRSRALPSHYAR